MPLSPRTQEMMQPPPTSEDATQAFEQGFSQMAHGILSGRFPELVEHVVTFKIINSDLNTGSGVGAFIVSLNGEVLHIPVVLANNQVKPFEVIYYPKKDMFLPLDKSWLDELARDTLSDLGKGTDAPKTLEPDADIRNLVVPPTTGRYAYASAGRVDGRETKGVPIPGTKLAQFLTEAPNYVKRAFAQILEDYPQVLKCAFEHFDHKALLRALQPRRVKTAAPKICFVTPDDNADTFKEVFGSHADKAWRTAIKYGFVVRDTRTENAIPVEVEERIVRTTAEEPGFYKLHMSDGRVALGLVIPEPQKLHSTLYAGVRGDIRRYPDEYRKWVKKQNAKKIHEVTEDSSFSMNAGDPLRHQPASNKEYIVVVDGKIIRTQRRPVGEPVHPIDVKGDFAKLLDDTVMPVGKGLGIFVRYKGGRLQGTEPVDILDITTGTDGVRRMRTYGNTLVTDPKCPTNAIIAPNAGNVTYIPPGFKFLKGEHGDDNLLLHGADVTMKYVHELQKTGARLVRILDAGADSFSIDGQEPQPKLAAVQSLIFDFGLRAPAALHALTKAAAYKTHSFYLVNPKQLNKFASAIKEAQGMPPGGMPPGGMPPGGMPPGGMPPGGMPPGGMPPGGMPPGGMPPGGMPPGGMPTGMGSVPPEILQQMIVSGQVSPEILQQMIASGQVPPEIIQQMIASGQLPPEVAAQLGMGTPPSQSAPPPPPSPIETAATEISAQLSQQAAAVAEQLAENQRDLANQLSAIDAIKQRAAQIAEAQATGQAPPPLGGVAQQPPQMPETGPGMVPGQLPPGVGSGMPNGTPPGGTPLGMPPGAGPEVPMGGVPPGGVPSEALAAGVPAGPPPGSPEEAAQAAALAQQAGPQMAQAAALNNPEVLEATAIGTMATDQNLSETVARYMPNLEAALDSLGRVLLSLWIKENELRPELGEQAYADLEKRIRTVFNNLGSLVLKINQTAVTTKEKDESEDA